MKRKRAELVQLLSQRKKKKTMMTYVIGQETPAGRAHGEQSRTGHGVDETRQP
jgi:hypothetical protein